MNKFMSLIIAGNIVVTILMFVGITKDAQRVHLATIANQQRLAQLAIDEIKVQQDYKAHPDLRVKGYNSDQVRVMKIAYNVGSEFGVPETIEGILLQETIAGKLGNRIGGVVEGLPFGKRYYGVTQMKLVAVEDVLKNQPEYVRQYFNGRTLSKVAGEEIIAKLISNDEFAIRMATLYFVKYEKQSKSMDEAIAMYNQGPAGAKKLSDPSVFYYVEGVRAHIKYNVKRFNSHYLSHTKSIKRTEMQRLAAM